MDFGKKRRHDTHGGRGAKKGQSPRSEPTLPNVDLVCSGVVSDDDKKSMDIQIHSFSVSIAGNDFVTSCKLKLRYGRSYGLIGSSGCGKSSLLRAVASIKSPIPSHMEVYCPSFEAEHGHLSVRDYITSCEEEKGKMQHQYENLLTMEDGGGEALDWLSTRLGILEEAVEERALDILYGLGFDKRMQAQRAEDLATGWRMRLALAKALFLRPAVLLLDEPTTSLDLGTSIWLAVSLQALQQKCILVVVSNDADFLNMVCSDIIHMHDSVLEQFDGTYDQYVQANGVPVSEKVASFHLTDSNVGQLVPPILQLAKAAYGYNAEKLVFKDLDFDIHLNSRIALVGSKGSGKTTLLNLLSSKLSVQDNRTFACSSGLRIGYFDQHLIEDLDLNASVRQHMKMVCPEKRETDFGLSRAMLSTTMRRLSHGQKVTVAFACLAAREPHLLLIDDPTVHLDIESINSLGNALKKWKGAFVLVSNNVRLINQVSSDIWICGSLGVIKHSGNIMNLKEEMQRHDTYMRQLQIPTIIRDTYPLFGALNYNEVALPSLRYKKYVDSSDGIFIPGCIPFVVIIKQRAMVSSAPSTGLKDGEMELQGEVNPAKSYRMTTEPGKLIARSILEEIHYSESIGEALGDFDSSHLWVTPSGRVIFAGVERQKLCPVQRRKSQLAAHTVIKDMCSQGGDIPEDVQYLLDMIEHEPDTSPLYHILSCLVPRCRSTGLFMKLHEHVLKDIDPVIRDQILLKVPYVANQVWHGLVKDNEILMETYTYGKGSYTLPPLKAPITPQQQRERCLKEAKIFLDYLRNRVCHRMDYLQQVKRYIADGSDLATLARFSLVSCVLQKELFRANHLAALNLDQFL